MWQQVATFHSKADPLGESRVNEETPLGDNNDGDYLAMIDKMWAAP